MPCFSSFAGWLFPASMPALFQVLGDPNEQPNSVRPQGSGCHVRHTEGSEQFCSESQSFQQNSCKFPADTFKHLGGWSVSGDPRELSGKVGLPLAVCAPRARVKGGGHPGSPKERFWGSQDVQATPVFQATPPLPGTPALPRLPIPYMSQSWPSSPTASQASWPAPASC